MSKKKDVEVKDTEKVEENEKDKVETTEEDLEKDSEIETEEESEDTSEEEEEVEETETEESEEEKKEDLPSVSLDNKPMSPLIKEEEEVIPPKFIPNHRAKKENKRELLVHNGRVYKKISSTHGIWADNGQAFSLSTLK